MHDSQLENFLKAARECHTKEAWERLFSQNQELVAAQTDVKFINDVFKLLRNDPQSLYYPTGIWVALLQSCLATWSLELGRKIAEYVDSVHCPKVATLSAQVHMESGEPARARDIANRTLRLKSIASWEKLQLQMIVCNTYVEEGKYTMAQRLLAKMEAFLEASDLSAENLADLSLNMGRARFFLGQYCEGAQAFSKAYDLHHKLGHWESALRSLFNAAACYENSGQIEAKKETFRIIEKCKSLAEETGFKGILAHCYAFHGTILYQSGELLEAIEMYKKSLRLLPATETSFRRLHIISMLTFAYLRNGQFAQGAKVGKKTIDLAKEDKSQRFVSRYIGLQAQIEWHEGAVRSSQKKLETCAKGFFAHGVQTLEDLSTLCRYYIQCAELNQQRVNTQVKIGEQLKSHPAMWTEYLHAVAQVQLTKKRFAESEKLAAEALRRSREMDLHYLRKLSLLTLIQTKLAQRADDEQLQEWLEDLSGTANSLTDPILIQLMIAKAGLSYQRGDFVEAMTVLQNIRKHKGLDEPTRLTIESWLATIQGHSPKLFSVEHGELVARATSIYFAPSVEAVDDTTFRVSGHYLVSLERQPILAQILNYLLAARGHSATPEELQQEVWRQSLQAVGWQQKIRNTIMRFRDCFPYTMAPLILHQDHQVRLFREGVELHGVARMTLSAEEKIIKLLKDGPMSSIQLSNSIHVSQATTKRLLKKLAEDKRIHTNKSGRNVLYVAETAQNQEI